MSAIFVDAAICAHFVKQWNQLPQPDDAFALDEHRRDVMEFVHEFVMQANPLMRDLKFVPCDGPYVFNMSTPLPSLGDAVPPFCWSR